MAAPRPQLRGRRLPLSHTGANRRANHSLKEKNSGWKLSERATMGICTCMSGAASVRYGERHFAVHAIGNWSRKKEAADERLVCVGRRSSAAVCFLVEDCDNKLPSG